MRQTFDLSGALVVGSAVGNVGPAFVQGIGPAGAGEALSALGEWIDAADPASEGYAEVAALHSTLAKKGLAEARAFFARNAEAVAVGLAGSAAWDFVKSVLGG